MKGRPVGDPGALAPYALAPGGESGAVPAAMAIRAGNKIGHSNMAVGNFYLATCRCHWQWRREARSICLGPVLSGRAPRRQSGMRLPVLILKPTSFVFQTHKA